MANAIQDDRVVRIRTNTIGTNGGHDRATGPWLAVLRARKEAGLTLRELAISAGVSELTVESVEAGAIERLPIGEPGQREIQSICRVLDLDFEPFGLAAREARALPLSRTLLMRQQPVERRSKLKVIVGAWILIIVVGLGIRAFIIRGDDMPPELAGSTEVAATETTIAPPTTTPPPPPPPAEKYAVEISASRSDTWLEVNIDGEQRFFGTLPRGEAMIFAGNDLSIVFGRPGSVDMVVNGETRSPERTVQLS